MYYKKKCHDCMIAGQPSVKMLDNDIKSCEECGGQLQLISKQSNLFDDIQEKKELDKIADNVFYTSITRRH